jgi:hypothetical protein
MAAYYTSPPPAFASDPDPGSSTAPPTAAPPRQPPPAAAAQPAGGPPPPISQLPIPGPLISETLGLHPTGSYATLLIRNIMGGAGPDALASFKAYSASNPLRAWRVSPRRDLGGGGAAAGTMDSAIAAGRRYPWPNVIPRTQPGSAAAAGGRVVAFGGGRAATPAAAASEAAAPAAGQPVPTVDLTLDLKAREAAAFASDSGKAAALGAAAVAAADGAVAEQVAAIIVGAMQQAVRAVYGKQQKAGPQQQLPPQPKQLPILFPPAPPPPPDEPSTTQPSLDPLFSANQSLPLVTRSDTSGLRDLVSTALANGRLSNERILQPGESERASLLCLI